MQGCSCNAAAAGFAPSIGMTQQELQLSESLASSHDLLHSCSTLLNTMHARANYSAGVTIEGRPEACASVLLHFCRCTGFGDGMPALQHQ